MENTAKNQQEMPKDPKPSDDVQLHIETVTPDSEKETKTSEENSASPVDANSDEKTETTPEYEKNKDKGTDERDQVETVSV